HHLPHPPPPPPTTLFPYTTLFRSPVQTDTTGRARSARQRVQFAIRVGLPDHVAGDKAMRAGDEDSFCHAIPIVFSLGQHQPRLRSEEHTSELQSRSDLVCRLLLEK